MKARPVAPAVQPAPTARPCLLVSAHYRWCRERQTVIDKAYLAVFNEDERCVGYLEWRNRNG